MEKLQNKIQFLLNLYKSKKLLDAENYAKELIQTHPNVVILYNILGLILTDGKKINEAIKYYERGIKINPNTAMIYNNLGSIYRSNQKTDKAENYFKKAIKVDNQLPEPYNNLGNLYLSQNKYKEAVVCFKKAININSNFYISHYNLAVAHKNMGEFKEAKKHLNKVTKINQFFCTGHRTLSQLTKYSPKDKHFNLLKKIYQNHKINDVQKAELSFALGKAYDDMEDYANAFKYYNEGNNLRRKKINFSLEHEKIEFNNIQKLFNKSLFEKFNQSGNLSTTPIFILGMPRSGTTLVEQMISSHPDVFGGDEIIFFNDLVKKNFFNKNEEFSLMNLHNKDKNYIKSVGDDYIDNLKKISSKAKKITDKLPINFKWIGLIRLILPNAKIIHCIRNSKDTCLSIYKTFFINPELNFAYNLEEIVEFYNLYFNLMCYWKKILPDFIIEAQYEEIIKNPESEIKNLLKFCGLPWNKNCLKFFNNKRPIKTASDTQARKKIYKSSINLWKNYENELGIFFKELSN